MNLSTLDNREILFIYFSNRRWVDTYEDIFEHKSIEDVMSILDFGQIRVTQPLSDEDMSKMTETEHYKLCNQIHEKLHAVVELIEEADPDLYASVKDCFNKVNI
jgi:malonyl CoA-acyl carrier protein transacylase